MSRHEVAVVGGGVVGSALALGLARAGVEVVLVEARAAQPWHAADYDLRVFAVSPASQAMLSRLGAWDGVRARRLQPYARMRVWETGDADELSFSAADIAADELGWIVEDAVLKAALWERVLATPAISVIAPARVEALTVDARRATLTLDDGRRIDAALVVAADGAHSRVRELAGIAVDDTPYGQRAIVAHLPIEKPHEDTAWQRFTIDGPLAMLPLADGRASLVWSVRDERARELLALDDADFAAAVGAALGGRFGAIGAPAARAAFPLRMMLARAPTAPRVVALGDAAHVMLPLAGQGLNIGLADAAALVDAVAAARTSRTDVGGDGVLAAYTRARAAEAAIAARVFDTLDGLFRGDLGPLPLLRRRGMALVGRIGPLRRQLALVASGHAGDPPSLCRRA